MQAQLLSSLRERVPLPMASVPYVLEAELGPRSLEVVADGLERSLRALGAPLETPAAGPPGGG